MKQRSWKTTSAGIATIVTTVMGIVQKLTDNDQSTNPDWNTVVPILIVSIGSIFARDNNRSSEQVGAGGKPETPSP